MKIVKTVNDMDKIEKIRQESEELYARIDECIGALIKARLNKDTDGEGKSLFQMEGLMVGTQQFLCWISDTLLEEPDKSLEEAAVDFVWDMMEDDYYGPSELSKRLRPTSKLDDFYGALAEIFIAGAKWQTEHLKRLSDEQE